VQLETSQLETTLETTAQGDLAWLLKGCLDLTTMEKALKGFDRLIEEKKPSSLRIDCRDLSYLDSAGAMTLLMLEQKAGKKSIKVSLENLSKDASALKSLIDLDQVEKTALKPVAKSAGFVENLGQSTLDLKSDLGQSVSFLGAFFISIGKVIKRPGLLRWGDVAFYMEQVGVNGLPIIGLIGFLLGMIMAFMSSLQLKDFGANIYVASLVAVAMVRELGPILVAGRSGSSFAAEIGTMKVNEEVDALSVMGFDPMIFLAMPKVLAALIMVPILTVYANVMAIIGGLLVGVTGLDLTAYAYLNQTINSLDPFWIGSGMVKSAVFAIIIAGVGCQQGFLVRGGAQSVGRATTKAVVAAMFLIIVADSAFAVILHYVE
jgi:phospholipid/cholesterol/gamma-HCH transport system permease protein